MINKELIIKSRITSIVTEPSITPEVKTERLYVLLQELIKKSIIASVLILTVLIGCNSGYCADKKPVKKSVAVATPNENKIRIQQFNTCVAQTGSRSRCRLLYY